MLLLALAGCGGFSQEPWWVDSLVADSPCYRVDLLDGLDASSTTELHDLFGCLDRHGHFDALVPLDRAFDAPTRTGDAVGIEIARLAAHLPEVDVDPFALGDVLLEAVRSDGPIDAFLDVSLELAYGVPATDVRAGAVDLGDPAALGRGVLAPLRPVLPVAALALLEDDTDAAAFAGELLVDPETARWIRTIASVVETPDPAVSVPLEPFLVHLGEAVALSRTTANDRWPLASGDSLRDLAEFFVVRDNPVVDEISPAVDAMLSDPLVLDALVPMIDGLAADAHLAPLGAEIAWLASVDTDSTAVESTEPTALYRFVRLLAENNHEIECSIDLVIVEIPFSFGNLAVSTLELVADLTPGQVQTLASIVTALTGTEVTEDLIELAGGAFCPSLGDLDQTFDDLESLETLQQPESYDVLVAFIELLQLLENGQSNHIPAFADLAEALFDAGGLEPAEEAIRDLGASAVMSDVLTLVPLLVHPEDHGISAGAEPANDLADLLEIVRWAFAVDPSNGLTGFQRMRPLLAPILGHDGTWDALGHAGVVLADPRSESSHALELVPVLVELDPDLEVLTQLGPLLGDRELSQPLLRIVEVPDVSDALLSTTTEAGQPEVPVAFWGRLVVTGALEDLLRLANVVIDTLGG